MVPESGGVRQAVIGLCGSGGVPDMAGNRPNVILYTTDQHRGDHIDLAGPAPAAHAPAPTASRLGTLDS
jgi:hypothetical protein